MIGSSCAVEDQYRSQSESFPHSVNDAREICRPLARGYVHAHCPLTLAAQLVRRSSDRKFGERPTSRAAKVSSRSGSVQCLKMSQKEALFEKMNDIRLQLQI